MCVDFDFNGAESPSPYNPVNGRGVGRVKHAIFSGLGAFHAPYKSQSDPLPIEVAIKPEPETQVSAAFRDRLGVAGKSFAATSRLCPAVRQVESRSRLARLR